MTHLKTQANRAIRRDRDRPVVSCRGKGAKHFFDNPAVLDFGNPECKFGKESAWALGDSELEGLTKRLSAWSPSPVYLACALPFPCLFMCKPLIGALEGATVRLFSMGIMSR